MMKDWQYFDGISPLVARVQAFEMLQRAENYLYHTTYASNGAGCQGWSQWYVDTQEAVNIMRASELALRYDIAKRIGATLNEDQLGA